MQTEWIDIATVRPGDLVKVPPGGSSWAYWACEAQARRSDAPFRGVVRVIVGWHGVPALVRLCFEDGGAGQARREHRVLRRGA
jgi:hypothetical protein